MRDMPTTSDDDTAETRSAPGDLTQETKRPRRGKGGYHAGGFTSGPPWPTTPKTEAPWGGPSDVREKQELLIDKEINALAQESTCGIGKWRPQWLQRFATTKSMLLWLCWYCAIQGVIVNGLVPSTISTIERRFQLSTSTIGRIIQFYDFGFVLFCIPVSYFGGRHSKPLVLAFGLSCMLLGSFMFTAPHFFVGPYKNTHDLDQTSVSQCTQGSSQERNGSLLEVASTAQLQGCIAESKVEEEVFCMKIIWAMLQATFRYVVLFCLAHFLHGIGATPLFTIGVSYIDENVGPALSSLYVGIFYSFGIFGPAVGFLAAGYFLRFHTDFLRSDTINKILEVDEMDPGWVGAWWLGFHVVVFAGLLAVAPILALPKVLPASLQWHRTRLREETLTGPKKRSPECCGMPSTSKTAALSADLFQLDDKCASVALAESMPAVTGPRKGPLWYQLWLDIRHIPIAIYRILTNGSYMLITLSMAVDGLVVAGASTFMSKYLERQFGVAPSKASVLIGCIMVPMAGAGTMFSGFIVQHFRLTCVGTIRFSMLLLLATLCLTPMYLIYCDHDPLVGVEKHYDLAGDFTPWLNDSQPDPTLDFTCNSGCDCSPTEYRPVCAELQDGRQMAFYSPCYAGCPAKYNSLNKFYDNCTCVPENTKGAPRRVKKGFCESKCTGLFGFLVIFAPLCFCTFGVGVPLISVVLRTVDYAERSFALGIQWILVRVIGTIPAPVIFGWIFDTSCIGRHLDPCSGEEGSCMLYFNKLLADLFLTFSIIGQLISMVLLGFVLMFFSGSLRDEPRLPPEAADLQQVNGGEPGEQMPLNGCGATV